MAEVEFGGVGTPPPSSGRGGSKKIPEFGFDEKVTVQTKEGPRVVDRRLFLWRLKPGEKDRKVLILDPKHDKNRKRFALFLTGPFSGRDGRFGSVLASCHTIDPEGDPMTEALGKEPTWHWALTAIDLAPFTSEKSGKTYLNRTLVLVTDKQKGLFLGMEGMSSNGLRGHVFNVSREDDKQSFKIGTEWDPVENLTEDEMRERFADAATNYGMSIDDFLAPAEYGKILKPKPRSDLLQIASSIKTASEIKGGVQTAEGDDQAIPF